MADEAGEEEEAEGGSGWKTLLSINNIQRKHTNTQVQVPTSTLHGYIVDEKGWKERIKEDAIRVRI